VLELDKRRSADDGSWLAHVYVGNRLLSDAVIRAGWARYEPHSGDSFAIARLLREAEQQARQEGRGMWAGP
jgi:endonuclease YncB( thermonuclease family)